jgi:hypothetical protein
LKELCKHGTIDNMAAYTLSVVLVAELTRMVAAQGQQIKSKKAQDHGGMVR